MGGVAAAILALVCSASPGLVESSTASLEGAGDTVEAGDTAGAGGDLGGGDLGGGDLEIGDAPLSDEDLALLAALDTNTATTSTLTASHEQWWLAPAPLARPTILLPRVRMREAIARSISEAFESYPTIVDSSRRFVPGDSAIIRGQSRHRVAITMEGVPLDHALSKSRETAGWFTLDPWMLEEALVERPGVLGTSPRGSAGSIALSAVEPGDSGDLEVEAEVEARTADRSTVTHVAFGTGTEEVAVRFAAGYGDHRTLRISTSSVGQDFGSGYQRIAATARARLFGRPNDPVRIYLGTDLDRLLNVERTDLQSGESYTVDRSNDRWLAFARVDFGGEELGGSVLGARQMFTREFGPLDDKSAVTTERADTWFLKGSLHAAILRELVASAGALIELGEATVAPPRMPREREGDTRTALGFVALDLDTEWINAYAVAAVTNGATTIVAQNSGGIPARTVEETRVLTQGGARLRIAGPLGFRAGWSQGLYVPNVRDLRVSAGLLESETSISIDAGPSFYWRDGFAELLGFFTLIESAIEPESLASERLVNIRDVDILGLELTGGVFVTDSIRVAGVLTWTEGHDAASRAPVITFPTITGRASVRYDFGARNAFLEAHLRGTSSPIHVMSIRAADPPASLAGLAPTSHARVGVMGGVDLGLGFRLEMTLENVIDSPYRAPTSLVPGAGVDVRAALSYAWR